MTGPSPHYPSVPRSPSFPALEQEIIAGWKADSTFSASVERRPAGADGDNEYVFYDGPPFANGLPHYGHILTGFVKDVVPRYKTMRGRRVERRFGWDCHGLPVEMQAEKELGVSGRGAIFEYGIERFNSYCRQSVLRYTAEWQSYVERQARWVDFENSYRTMDLPYMETVMWAIKQLWKEDLLYEDYRVLPYCWECETPLSSAETRQDGTYQDRQDPAVTVAFKVPASAGPGANTPGISGPFTLWAWTTTPWTLPSNLAIAVGPELDYAVFRRGDETIVLGARVYERYQAQLEGAVRVATVKGHELVGRPYEPLFGYFEGTPHAFVVLGADFVSTEDGTGVVHMAPGFGEDDQTVCAAAGIPVVCPVDSRARFTAEVPDFEGFQVFDANQPVVRALRAAGSLVRSDSYVHSYPHCWRSDTPLIYKAVTSWFVKVTAIRDQMLATNEKISWFPNHVKDGSFGKWLAGARDWSISRNRFWGSPIAIWKSDDPNYPRTDVYGSLDELEADFGVRPRDLHRPQIDSLTRPNPDDPSGRSTMRRVEDVLDCWFESGSMPFAQVHYPFENQSWFESHFPGDFIVEYITQTRGWFYSLHVLATAIFGQPAFTTAIAHGIVLGDDGLKMSKRFRNYPDPEAMYSKHGADAMRWYLMASPILRGGDLVVSETGIAGAVRAAILPLWNAWYFFALYANADRREASTSRSDSPSMLDMYALAKAHELVVNVTSRMDEYDISGACSVVQSFLDSLNNWYIRRSRDRFWGTGDPDDGQSAFDTLATVLEALCRVAAPLLPMVTESIWRGLTGGRSVHLEDWPDAGSLPADPALVSGMDRTREICSSAHSIRKAAGRRARLPLRRLTIALQERDGLDRFCDLIADEVNVKEVELTTDVDRFATRSLTVVFQQAAPRLGPSVQDAARAARAGDWELIGEGKARAGGVELLPGEFDMRLVPMAPASSRALSTMGGIVVLDLDTDDELEAEGMARDVVRGVQQERRDLGLDVSDRIDCTVWGPAQVQSAGKRFHDWIASQILAVDLKFEVGDAPAGIRSLELSDGTRMGVEITRA